MGAETFILLGLTVLLAACLQSATGIGFGVIAGPIFLVILNSNEAFQLSTLHNLAIVLVLVPSIWKSANKQILKNLLVGGFLGLFLGLVLQLWASMILLKIAAILMIALVIIALIYDISLKVYERKKKIASIRETQILGIIAGIMGGMLAMPGPIAAAWLAVKGIPKKEIRATTIVFFAFVYGVNTLFYTVYTGISKTILKLAFLLLPPIILGILLGKILAEILSERTFRVVLLSILFLTVLMLTLS